MEEFDLNGQKFAGFWRRFMALNVDGLVLAPFSQSFRYILEYIMFDLRNPPLGISLEILTSLLLFLYKPFFLSRYGKTPGKMILNIKVINHGGEIISFYRALFRDILVIPLIIYRIYETILMYRQISIGNPAFTSSNSAYLWLFKNQQAYMLALFGFLFSAVFIGIIQLVFVLFNRKKRALHDFIAGTFVIVEDRNVKIRKGLLAVLVMLLVLPMCSYTHAWLLTVAGIISWFIVFFHFRQKARNN